MNTNPYEKAFNLYLENLRSQGHSLDEFIEFKFESIYRSSSDSYNEFILWYEKAVKKCTMKSELIAFDECKDWNFKNIKLYAGDVKKTTKAYQKESFGSRIALLYLDVDNYEGTLEILKNLYNKMSKGGVIAFDEYALRGHGESDAVDEFLKDKKIKLRSFGWAKSPTAYAVIE